MATQQMAQERRSLVATRSPLALSFTLTLALSLALPLLLGLSMLACGGEAAGEKPEDSASQPADGGAASADGGSAADDWAVNSLNVTEGPTNVAVAANGWYRGDLHFHTDYSEDAKKQGGDDVATCLKIADAWREPTYLARYPERAGNGLDFVAITDHRTVAAGKDPNFKHDHLIVLLGAEYGGNGHAGIWGVKDYVTHIPAKGQSETERHQQSIKEVHAQGGLFSPNHPTQHTLWHWDVSGYDAVEVWNAPWSAFWPEEKPAYLDEKTSTSKRENPWIRHALTQQGGGTNNQALWFWYGHLASGLHPAAVGGSDRHMLVPAALPTTYVHKPSGAAWQGKDGKALGPKGIIAGIKAGGTFVSRSPLGAQILLTASSDPASGEAKTYPQGAELPAGERYRIHITVTRAEGGLLRLVGGPRVKPDAKGRIQAQAKVLFEAPIQGQRAEGAFTWNVPAEGGWIHALVLEPRIVGTLPESLKSIAKVTSTLPKSKAVGSIVKTMLPLMDDSSVLFDAKLCQPKDWKENKALCMPIDKMTWSTFYLPEAAVRLMNTWFVDNKPTQWSMAAVSAAFTAPPRK